MCGGVKYIEDHQEKTVYFPNPFAKLPIVKKDGSLELLPWGRRKHQSGNLPLGGWARLESIQQHRWDKYFPKPIKIKVDEFMEKDIEGISHWFPIVKGQYIQGLLATYDKEQRVYVVTVTPQQENAIHDRWPKIVLDHV